MQNDATLKLSDAQARTNPDSTGTVSSNVLDLEQDSGANVILTDDQLIGYGIFTITAYSFTSGGTEGISLQIRNGDNSDCATAAEIIGQLDVPLADIAAGKQFSVPFHRDVAERYVGGWLAAKSTQLVGTITTDLDLSNLPSTPNDHIQKVPS